MNGCTTALRGLLLFSLFPGVPLVCEAATLSGNAQDAQGKPVASLIVFIVDRQTNNRIPVATNQKGNFTAELPKGHYVVYAEQENRTTFLVFLSLDSKERRHLRIQVTEKGVRAMELSAPGRNRRPRSADRGRSIAGDNSRLQGSGNRACPDERSRTSLHCGDRQSLFGQENRPLPRLSLRVPPQRQLRCAQLLRPGRGASARVQEKPVRRHLRRAAKQQVEPAGHLRGPPNHPGIHACVACAGPCHEARRL